MHDANFRKSPQMRHSSMQINVKANLCSKSTAPTNGLNSVKICNSINQDNTPILTGRQILYKLAQVRIHKKKHKKKYNSHICDNLSKDKIKYFSSNYVLKCIYV